MKQILKIGDISLSLVVMLICIPVLLIALPSCFVFGLIQGLWRKD